MQVVPFSHGPSLPPKRWGRPAKLMKRNLERQTQQALIAITLSVTTLVICFGLLLLR